MSPSTFGKYDGYSRLKKSTLHKNGHEDKEKDLHEKDLWFFQKINTYLKFIKRNTTLQTLSTVQSLVPSQTSHSTLKNTKLHNNHFVVETLYFHENKGKDTPNFVIRNYSQQSIRDPYILMKKPYNS